MYKKIREIESYIINQNVEKEKNIQFLKLVKKISNNQFYKKWYSENAIDLKSIKSIDDIVLLPKLTKRMVKENATLIKDSKFMVKGYTSGTSGSPLVVYRDLNSIITENAYVWWFRMQSGLNPEDKKISIRGDLGKDQLFHFDGFSNTLHISSFNINQSNFNMIFKKIKNFSPVGLIGYPSSIYNLSL